MIHAYLCFGNMESKDRSYHGWTFIEKLNEINAKANVEITVSKIVLNPNIRHGIE